MHCESIASSREPKLDDFRSEVREKLEGVRDLSAVMANLVAALDPSRAGEEGRGEMDMSADEEEGTLYMYVKRHPWSLHTYMYSL